MQLYKPYTGQLNSRIEAFENRVKDQWNGEHLLRGKRPSSDSIMLVSNDYLCLNNHPQIVTAQINSLRNDISNSPTLLSSIFLGNNSPQGNLEAHFADFLGTEASIICQSGWVANVGLIQSIASPETPVYIDQLAHMSLWEGARSGAAKVVPFKHNSLEDLEYKLKANGSGIIVVDSIYSTNGSIAPLNAVADLAKISKSMLIVDESHSLGTHGPMGRGLVAELNLLDRLDFITASLAKAFAARAGLITCRKRFVEYFRITSLPAIFSSALLPSEIAGLFETLHVIKGSHERRTKLKENTSYLRSGLTQTQAIVSPGTEQIIAIEGGEERITLRMRDIFEEHNVFASVFCAPATSKRRSILRLSVHSDLSQYQLDKVIDAAQALNALN